MKRYLVGLFFVFILFGCSGNSNNSSQNAAQGAQRQKEDVIREQIAQARANMIKLEEAADRLEVKARAQNNQEILAKVQEIRKAAKEMEAHIDELESKGI